MDKSWAIDLPPARALELALCEAIARAGSKHELSARGTQAALILWVSASPVLSSPDKLALGFILGLGVTVLGVGAAPIGPVLLLLAQAVAILALASWGARSKLGKHFHAFGPVVVVIALFETLGSIIPAINPRRLDAELARADSVLFGSLAETWRNALGRADWLTDLASLCYVSFYFLPVLVAIALYRRSDQGDFDTFATVIVATFLASYVGYLLFPAVGPRVAPELEPGVLGGGVVRSAVFGFMHLIEKNQLDAFPSGHAAIAVATLVQAWKSLPRGRFLLALAVAGIAFSTVYLSLHYVVDLVAGITLGLAVPSIVGLSGHAVRRAEA